MMTSDWSELDGVDESLKRKVYIVKKTWKQLLTTGPMLSTLFYRKLFELDPELRQLFGEGTITTRARKKERERERRLTQMYWLAETTRQELKLVRMLDIMISHLGCLGRLTATLEDVAIRHIGYNVLPEDYATVGTCRHSFDRESRISGTHTAAVQGRRCCIRSASACRIASRPRCAMPGARCTT